MFANATSKLKRPRRSNYHDDCITQKFTSGLETKLVRCIGLPAESTRKFLRKKFEQELSYNNADGIQYDYTTQKTYQIINSQKALVASFGTPYWMDQPVATSRRGVMFNISLFCNAEDELMSFNFSLSIAQE